MKILLLLPKMLINAIVGAIGNDHRLFALGGHHYNSAVGDDEAQIAEYIVFDNELSEVQMEEVFIRSQSRLFDRGIIFA